MSYGGLGRCILSCEREDGGFEVKILKLKVAGSMLLV